MSTKAQPPTRLDHVDALRGLAVIFMLVLHTAHGWLAHEVRGTGVWAAITLFGGMAAPLFLFLSGVSLGLRRQDPARPPAGSVRRDVARGLQIILLGYALRLQMWWIDGGGFGFAGGWAIGGLLLLAYLAAYSGCSRLTAGTGASSRLAVALVSWVLGMALVSMWIPHRMAGLVRVDVLQAIGAAQILVSWLGARGGGLPGRPGRLLCLAALTAAATPLMRSWVPGSLPHALAAYLAYWPPAQAGTSPAGLFPLFPWLAYAFAGAAVGILWARCRDPERLTEVLVAGAAVGALLALATNENLEQVRHALGALPALQQPLRVTHRVGLCLLFALAALPLSRLGPRSPLALLGRTSLLVYWVHLQFAFGLASRPWHAKLDPGSWLLGLLLLATAMTGLAWARLQQRAGRLPWPRTGAKSPTLGTSQAPINSET